MTTAEFFEQFGMTPEAAARVMGQFRVIMHDVIDRRVFNDEADDSWRETLEAMDIDTDGKARPSDCFELPHGTELFKALVSWGTFHGGMTSAREAMALVREEF